MFESRSAPIDLVVTPPEIEPVDLVDELDAVLARITREEARAAELLARVIEAGGFRRDGYSSATAMLKHRNSIHPNAASQMVARARNLPDAPLVSLAYARAAITTPQVDVLLHASETAHEPFSGEEARLVEWLWTLLLSKTSGNVSTTGWSVSPKTISPGNAPPCERPDRFGYVATVTWSGSADG